jgi:hypothetical protein
MNEVFERGNPLYRRRFQFYIGLQLKYSQERLAAYKGTTFGARYPTFKPSVN